MTAPSAPSPQLSLRRITLLAITLLACVQLSTAAPRDPTKPPATLQNPNKPSATPKSIPPRRPELREYRDFESRFRGRNWRQNAGKGPAWQDALSSSPNDRAPGKGPKKGPKLGRRALSTSASDTPSSTTTTEVVASSISSIASTSSATASSSAVLPATSALAPCVGSWANATYINSLFAYGGIGYTVELCPNANIILTDAIFLWWANQTLTTQGRPTDSSRATLTNASPDQACSIYAAIDYTSYITISHIQVNGARDSLGLIWGGLATIEMGGNTVGQRIEQVHSYEPRGWSALHIIEGYAGSCDSAIIVNNQLGPSGHAPSGWQQFKRDSTGQYPPGQWADGLSHACKNSLVQGNVITDATDGGIVVFGAPGSLITGNTIISDDRQLLGGINMVDWAPFGGSFVGTEVSGNSIVSKNSMIKLGIAIGVLSWGVDNRTLARTYGGVVKNNVFSSGPTGYFGYAISAAGVENTTISGNTASGATFGGVESPSCFTAWFPLPPPQAWIADQYTVPGCTLQEGFWHSTTWVLPICKGPNAS